MIKNDVKPKQAAPKAVERNDNKLMNMNSLKYYKN